MTAIFSFRLLDTLVYLLPPRQLRTWTSPRAGSGVRGKLTSGAEVCNAEPSGASGASVGRFEAFSKKLRWWCRHGLPQVVMRTDRRPSTLTIAGHAQSGRE